MDGDQLAKTFEQGANSALRNAEGSDSIHGSIGGMVQQNLAEKK